MSPPSPLSAAHTMCIFIIEPQAAFVNLLLLQTGVYPSFRDLIFLYQYNTISGIYPVFRPFFRYPSAVPLFLLFMFIHANEIFLAIYNL